jgi:hypothetical protein
LPTRGQAAHEPQFNSDAHPFYATDAISFGKPFAALTAVPLHAQDMAAANDPTTELTGFGFDASHALASDVPPSHRWSTI